MKLSLSDVYLLTLPELSEVAEQWNRNEQTKFQTSWEQTRFIAHKVLLPYAKKKLKLTDVARFEWDMKEKMVSRPVSKKDIDRMLKQFEDS